MTEHELDYAIQEQRIAARRCVVCDVPIVRAQGQEGKLPYLCASCVQQWAICYTCRRILSLSQFHRDSARRYGRRPYCHSCRGSVGTLSLEQQRERAHTAIILLDQGIALQDVADATGYTVGSIRAHRKEWRIRYG